MFLIGWSGIKNTPNLSVASAASEQQYSPALKLKRSFDGGQRDESKTGCFLLL